MRVSKATAAKNRERILKTAAKRFREKGLDGIGVADLMRDAGLTHGGFYGHFSSKEELIEKALADCMDEKAQQWAEIIAAHPKQPLKAVLDVYFSQRHKDDPGWGCPMAALGAEIARQPVRVRRAMTEGLLAFVKTLEPALPGAKGKARRQKALGVWATLVGAIMLARAVDDEALAEEIMHSATAAILRASK